MKKHLPQKKAYLVGGGISSLAAAVFLIRDGKISGKNITILEESAKLGGSLDAETLRKKIYLMRGVRIFEEKIYACTFDLFSAIPSLADPSITMEKEFFDFNRKNKICAKARLISRGKKINAKPLKLNLEDRLALIKLLLTPENSLQILSIEDYFTPSFFKSNFWIEFCTVFAFQPWHSLVEFRRYALRVMQNLPGLDTTKAIRLTPYNQYDSIVLPLVKWLENHGVNFKPGCRVKNLEFNQFRNKKTVTQIFYIEQGKEKNIDVEKNDYVFTTLGSITADSSIGSMDKAPGKPDKENAAWLLWKNIAKSNPDFGNPRAFIGDTDKSKWISFTITSRTPLFFNSIEKLTGQEAGTGGPITFSDSNWLLTLGIPHQPYFKNQPDKLSVCWGYGLFPDKEGNYIRKKMSEASGREILAEVCYHLGLDKKRNSIAETTECIPCMMPYITSHFAPRKNGDRPKILPEDAANFAFLGQYCEMPDDIVFTVEYSVRSAQTAVYSLLRLDKQVPPVYKGWHHLKIIYKALETFFR